MQSAAHVDDITGLLFGLENPTSPLHSPSPTFSYPKTVADVIGASVIGASITGADVTSASVTGADVTVASVAQTSDIQ